MKKFSLIAAGAILTGAGMGIASVQAQDTAADMNDGVVVIEEESIVAEPVSTSVDGSNGWRADTSNSAAQKIRDRNNLNNATTRGINNPSAGSNNAPASDLRNDARQMRDNIKNNMRPDNQPVVDKALKNQNPTYNNN